MKLNEDLLTVAFSNIYEDDTSCLMVTRKDSDDVVNVIGGTKAAAIYKAMIGEDTMGSLDGEITIRSGEYRLCKAKGKLGYFHTWEHFSQPVEGSILMGGSPAGIVSRVYGIVEFEDGVDRFNPRDIIFCDEINNNLNMMSKHF